MSYTRIYEKYVYPIYHGLKRDGVLKARDDIESFLSMPPAEREATRQVKLQALLSHAYAHCPFYRKRFDEAGVDPRHLLADFENIPPLTKSDIGNHADSIRSVPSHRIHTLIESSTGGSTGEKLFFHFDRYCQAMRKATALFDLRQMGFPNGTRIAKIWGAPVDIDRASSIRGKMHAWITRTLMLSSYQLSDADMDRYAYQLRWFEPKVLVSYPSPLSTFCDHLARRDMKIPSVQCVVTSAEQLFDWQREKIESTFDCQVMNRYGSREFGDIAHEFPGSSGFHVHSFRLFLEILDDHGRPVENGNPGSIHLTDLDNFGMPFIRYRIEDSGTWEDPGHRGTSLGLPVIKTIEGRSFDVIEGVNGNRIGGTYWTILFRSRPGIKQFQIHQKKKDRIVVRYIPDSGVNPGLPENSHVYFIRNIREKCGSMMQIEFRCVDAIDKTVSGKTRLVISDIARLA